MIHLFIISAILLVGAEQIYFSFVTKPVSLEMKKMSLLLIITFLSFAGYSQTNELATATKLLVGSKNLATQTYGAIEFPTPKWNENTAWGKCMNTAAKECAKSLVCTAKFATASVAYIAGWSFMCAIYTNQTQIPQTKPL